MKFFLFKSNSISLTTVRVIGKVYTFKGQVVPEDINSHTM